MEDFVVSDENSSPLMLGSGESLRSYTYMVLPFMKKGTLLNLLMTANSKSSLSLSGELKQYLCAQAVRSVAHLHEKDKLAHGDIKPDNFLITDEYTLALIDFAHSKPIGQV